MQASPQLIDYIYKCKDLNQTKDQIKDSLLNAGWDEITVNNAIELVFLDNKNNSIQNIDNHNLNNSKIDDKKDVGTNYSDNRIKHNINDLKVVSQEDVKKDNFNKGDRVDEYYGGNHRDEKSDEDGKSGVEGEDGKSGVEGEDGKSGVEGGNNESDEGAGAHEKDKPDVEAKPSHGVDKDVESKPSHEVEKDVEVKPFHGVDKDVDAKSENKSSKNDDREKITTDNNQDKNEYKVINDNNQDKNENKLTTDNNENNNNIKNTNANDSDSKSLDNSILNKNNFYNSNNNLAKDKPNNQNLTINTQNLNQDNFKDNHQSKADNFENLNKSQIIENNIKHEKKDNKKISTHNLIENTNQNSKHFGPKISEALLDVQDKYKKAMLLSILKIKKNLKIRIIIIVSSIVLFTSIVITVAFLIFSKKNSDTIQTSPNQDSNQSNQQEEQQQEQSEIPEIIVFTSLEETINTLNSQNQQNLNQDLPPSTNVNEQPLQTDSQNISDNNQQLTNMQNPQDTDQINPSNTQNLLPSEQNLSDEMKLGFYDLKNKVQLNPTNDLIQDGNYKYDLAKWSNNKRYLPIMGLAKNQKQQEVINIYLYDAQQNFISKIYSEVLIPTKSVFSEFGFFNDFEWVNEDSFKISPDKDATISTKRINFMNLKGQVSFSEVPAISDIKIGNVNFSYNQTTNLVESIFLNDKKLSYQVDKNDFLLGSNKDTIILINKDTNQNLYKLKTIKIADDTTYENVNSIQEQSENNQNLVDQDNIETNLLQTNTSVTTYNSTQNSTINNDNVSNNPSSQNNINVSNNPSSQNNINVTNTNTILNKDYIINEYKINLDDWNFSSAVFNEKSNKIIIHLVDDLNNKNKDKYELFDLNTSQFSTIFQQDNAFSQLQNDPTLSSLFSIQLNNKFYNHSQSFKVSKSGNYIVSNRVYSTIITSGVDIFAKNINDNSEIEICNFYCQEFELN